ncbi:MAG: NAD-dependent epimerase/dehydratase family protein, partial [Betaproteobacteria bacterium]|nr:NAD-dependent epimerase/dehydratase family protein [Betaproteobacteria bacterium]
MNKKTQKTVLILGGSGFVGRYLTEALSTAGFRIRIPTRNRERVKGAFIVLPNVELLQTNITKLENLDSLIKGVDIVVNC